MSLVLFPAMAESWGKGDHKGFQRQTDHSMRLLVLVMVAIFGSLILCSRLLVSVVFGAEFRQAAQLLPVLLLAVLATSLGVAAVNSITTRSQRGMVLTSGASMAGLVTGAVVWVLLAPRLGIAGVAVGYLCGTVVIAGVPIVTVWRRDGHAWAGLMGRVAAGLVAALLLLTVEDRLGTLAWFDPAFAVLFLTFWCLLSRRDATTLLPPLLRRPGR